MSKQKGQIIVALDVDTFEEAQALVDTLSPVVNVFKVGSQLFTACGPVIIRHILARGKEVFLDLKFHDIPNTVGNAIISASRLGGTVHDVLTQDGEKIEPTKGLLMCTVHTMGGDEMLKAAVEKSRQQAEILKVRKMAIIGITVLTSDAKADSIHGLVLERAKLAKDAGLDGVVSSSQEAAIIRQEFGDDFIIVTPGIRSQGAQVGDQKRVTTPKEAILNGSNYLVVGRPVVKAEDPLLAANNILKEIEEV